MTEGPVRQEFLLSMEGIQKSFPGVQALKKGQLNLYAGEVLGLLGENGAGKSTLIKILSGAHRADAGSISIQGNKVKITCPSDAQHAGIAVIYQEFNLVPTLTARENIFLGQEKTSYGWIRTDEEQQAARALFKRMAVHIDLNAYCRDLPVAQQQLVEIAKALSLNARMIVMDEPSAALTSQEVDRLFSIIRDLQKQNIGIIYISHRLDEVFEICNRVTVMRDGEYIATHAIQDINRKMLIEMMVGRKLENEFPVKTPCLGDDRLTVKNLNRKSAVMNVSFSIKRGEILGLTGLVGAGRTEVARLIFGADRRDSGSIQLDGHPLNIHSPRDAIRHGICLLTEDRKSQGLILNFSCRENFALPNLAHWSRGGWIRGKEERTSFAASISSLKIKLPHQDELARNLSGGNQQKILIAKWLESHSEVIIFDEPTRGIDVGTKYEIYLLMNDLAAKGKAILMISSELPEVLGMSDRILVMHEGQIKGEILDVSRTTQEEIMSIAIGKPQFADSTSSNLS